MRDELVKIPSSEVKKRSFYLAIFNMIREGKTPAFISKMLKIPKQNVYYYTNNLKKWGFIEKVKRGRWRVLVKTLSVGTSHIFTKPKTNLHAEHIKIPILSGKINTEGWETREKLRNWTPQYKVLDALGGMTLKNNNNRSLSVYLHSRDIQNLKEIDNLTLDVGNFLNEYFKRQGVTLDLFNAEIKNLDIATEDERAEEMRGKGEKFVLDLDKKAEKILPRDNLKAKAMIDGSPFNFSAETNDKEWKRAYLQMPFNILGLSHSLPALQEYNRNLNLHIKVQEEQLKTLKKIQEALEK